LAYNQELKNSHQKTYQIQKKSKQNSKPLCTYIQRLSPEYGCLFLKDVCKRDKAAPTSRPIIEMISRPEYSQLMF